MLSACIQQNPADPACRSIASTEHSLTGTAYCVIKHKDHILSLSQGASAKMSLPSSPIISSDNAACALHQATWEQTGLNVELGELLAQGKGQYFFACAVAESVLGDLQTLPVPAWSMDDISSIQLVDPFNTPLKLWQNDIDLIYLRDSFNQIESSPLKP